LFWDLENIAFSHLKCNIPDQYKNGSLNQRKIGEQGTAWCSKHQQFLPVELFSKGSRWNGFNPWCKECINNKKRESRANKLCV
jgi:hypothetical protein